MFKQIGPMEIVLILAVLVLLFGAKKLPELARGSGRALRIFKSETKGLMDDDDDKPVVEKPVVEKPVVERTAALPSDVVQPTRPATTYDKRPETP
ncbi:Sec-independent protein translocase subunit TatA [Mumia sp. zg.B53]|uniref:Sec-independent protein translocase subunit TatA n=1 Tax=unclassified Mumia TaxID=2621872 RepID=UPI001C6E9C1D|nr:MULTISPECIES: Sec-independent protein translocase subunit TatA [unclassified Mumia]MBW9205079.1 Sec-independent protein translocase subunit TatA [Mumia sp. zg.B17]MBW9213529.1 Sec-independent protein translocase subunit TatA [Mumia sp. zg.B53]